MPTRNQNVHFAIYLLCVGHTDLIPGISGGGGKKTIRQVSDRGNLNVGFFFFLARVFIGGIRLMASLAAVGRRDDFPIFGIIYLFTSNGKVRSGVGEGMAQSPPPSVSANGHFILFAISDYI